jgi:hypothetical protein
MSTLGNEYLRQAEFCQSMAKRAETMEKKSAWLRLAGKWLDLAVAEQPSFARGTASMVRQQRLESV